MCIRRVSNRPPRRGYVLLVVLAVSVLVLTVLGSLANVSLRRGLEASDARRSLQQRWGTATLQRTLLNRAPKLFELREERLALAAGDAPPPPTLRGVIVLGGITFDLLLGDEDSKLNLNSLYHHAGKMKTEQALAQQEARLYVRLTPACEPMQLSRQERRITRGPEDEDDAEALIPDAFRSWGEVMDLANLDRAGGPDSALANLTTGMTCWGSGQLNIRRATDDAFLAIVGSVVQDGAARRMLQRYRDRPEVGISGLLQSEVNDPADRQRLSTVISDQGNNYSLWVHSSAIGVGTHQQFVVMRRDEEGVTRFETFAH